MGFITESSAFYWLLFAKCVILNRDADDLDVTDICIIQHLAATLKGQVLEEWLSGPKGANTLWEVNRCGVLELEYVWGYFCFSMNRN